MLTVKNLQPTIIPKSNQLNSEQLLAGPMTIKITDVSVSDTPDQPVNIHYENENGRPFKPCKTVRKILLFAWGDDGTKWIGRSMTLFNDPDVKWAGVKVGGIRISHMSDIEADLQLQLTATRGKKEPFIIKRLGVRPQPVKNNAPQAVNDADIASARSQLSVAAQSGLQSLQQEWGKLSAEIRTALGGSCPQEYKDIANAPPPVEDVPAATDNDGEMF